MTQPQTPEIESHAEAGSSEYTRGEFLTKATIGVGGLLGAMIGVPVAGMALQPALVGSSKYRVSAGKIEDFEMGKFKKVVLEPNADAPDAYVQKRVVYIRHNESKTKDRLAPKGQGEFTVISNRCAHLGCPVTENSGNFVCPCHGGSYNEDGDRTGGPPVRPLDRFTWEKDGGELILTEEYSLTPSGSKKKLRGPGQPTSGPEGLLYPLQP